MPILTIMRTLGRDGVGPLHSTPCNPNPTSRTHLLDQREPVAQPPRAGQGAEDGRARVGVRAHCVPVVAQLLLLGLLLLGLLLLLVLLVPPQPVEDR